MVRETVGKVVANVSLNARIWQLSGGGQRRSGRSRSGTVQRAGRSAGDGTAEADAVVRWLGGRPQLLQPARRELALPEPSAMVTASGGAW